MPRARRPDGTRSVLLRPGLQLSPRRLRAPGLREIVAAAALVAPRLSLLLVHLS